MHFYNHLTSLLILIISINLLDVPSINVMLQSAEQQGVVIILNSMESSGHSRLLVDYYLSIIGKSRAHQAILTLYSHISDQDISSP